MPQEVLPVHGELRFPGDDTPVEGPVVFLAGPIQGAGPWHPEAMALILRDPRLSHVTIASPRSPAWVVGSKYDAKSQVQWETRWLNRAARCGAILFWMAKEVEHFAHRSYAQTTRYEYAEWKEKALRNEATLVVGIEKGYSGEGYIRLRAEDENPTAVFHTTLPDTVEALAKHIQETWPI